MKGPATGHDWIRVILMVAVSTYMTCQIYNKTKLLLKWEMGFTEVAVDADIMKFPSISFCPASQDYRKWREVDNITADYENVSRREDLLIKVSQQISINR